MTKKLLLTSAITAALGLSVGMNANAFVDFADSDNNEIPVYSSSAAPNTSDSAWPFEITSDAIGANNVEALGLTGELGFSATVGSSRYVRVELSDNMRFAPGATLDFSVDGKDPQIAVSGGGAGQSSVVLEISVTDPDEGLNFNDVWELDVSAIQVASQAEAAYTVTVSAYQDLSDALAGDNAFVGPISNDYILWGDPIAINCDAVTPAPVIDVLAQENWFGDSPADTQALFEIEGSVGDGVLNLASEPFAWVDAFDGDPTLLVEGPTAGLASVEFDPAAVGPFSITPSNGEAEYAPWIVDSTSGTPLEVSLTTATNGSAMVPGDWTATVSDTEGNTLFGPEVCATTFFSGTTDRLDFATSRDLAGANFRSNFRVVNPGDQGGNVTLTVITDTGEEFSAGLGDLTGGSDFLDGKNSTAVFTIDALLSAAGVEESDLDGALNKVRVEARAEFDGVIIQGFIIGSDNRSFTPMNYQRR